jgi:radical SAM superfamily enzyme YgiQ (UPF0313 family)
MSFEVRLMDKKILLLYPYFKTHFITPPVGLGYLASYIAKNLKGVEVKLVDCNLERYSEENISTLIDTYRPSVVGLTVYTSFYNQALRLIKKIKSLNPDIKIVVGGPHPSGLPEDVLKNPEIDFVVLSEGEETFLELLQNINNPGNYSTIKGLVYRDGNGIRVNSLRENIRDLDSLPFPAWRFIPPDRYPNMPHGGIAKRYPVAPIVSSRGCPFNCSFCGSEAMWHRKWRVRSPKDVVDEIEFLVKNHGVREVHFEDDNFTLDKMRAIGICKEIMKRQLDVAWSCPNGVRVDAIDKGLLKIMKLSGCYSLGFGIESGDKKILERVNKRIDLDMVENAIRMAKEEGIKTTGFFIIGLPGETKETILNTISLSKRLPLDRAQFGLFAPLPGSSDYDLWIKEQKPRDIDWDRFNFYNVIFKLDGLSDGDVKALQKKAFREFYLRPKVIFNMMKDMHFKEVVPIFKRLRSIFIR